MRKLVISAKSAEKRKAASAVQQLAAWRMAAAYKIMHQQWRGQRWHGINGEISL
jgi:hypothetical protein